MRVAAKSVLFLAPLLAACAQAGESDQNAAQGNAMSGPTEVEALPPDESVAATSDALANGTVETNNAAESSGY